MMIQNSTKKIYSICNTFGTDSLVEIEVVILNGLYKFSILGINQKISSDTKDRVYSALRSQKLLNLKSDNRKITVNLLPTNIDKKDSFYDLGIALGCLINMDKMTLSDDILVVGELSILGNIIPSGYILKAIYSAVKYNIKTIVCSKRDFDTVNTLRLNTLIKEKNIKFIFSDNLFDLIDKIKQDEYHTHKEDRKLCTREGDIATINIVDKNLFKIILALSTNRNVLIENKNDSFVEIFIQNLMFYIEKLEDIKILEISNILNKNDHEIIDKYTYPIISTVNKQTYKHDLYRMIRESAFGFNIVEDIAGMSEEVLHIVKFFKQSSVLCFYKSCPCGNSNLLFNSISMNRCFCLQRNIIRYRQKIRNLDGDFFDFCIKDIEDGVLEFTPEDYISINRAIDEFKKNKIEIFEGDDYKIFSEKYFISIDRKQREKLIVLSKDIVKLNFILKGVEPVLTKDILNMAKDFIRKDF